MGTQVQPKVVSGNAAGYDPLRVKRIAWRLFVFFFTLGFGFSMHLVTQLLTYLDYEYRVEPAKDVVFNLKNCDFQILKDADRDGLHARWLYADDGGVKSSGLNDANDYKVEVIIALCSVASFCTAFTSLTHIATTLPAACSPF
jgi:hypothetical protein